MMVMLLVVNQELDLKVYVYGRLEPNVLLEIVLKQQPIQILILFVPIISLIFFTTRSRCVSKTTKQQSYEGPNNCSWQPICTSTSNCSAFTKKSICVANQARVRIFDKNNENGNPLFIFVSKKFDRLNNTCKELSCSDLTGAYNNSDANCAAELLICIITFRNIIYQFKLSRYCTNSSTATDNTPCVQRKCSYNTQVTDNATCASFLPECISNGKGCVDQITPCASMKGTQENLIRYLIIRPDLLINLQLINVTTVQQPLKMIIVKSKLANQQKTKMMVHVIHFQMDISIMEMESVLSQMLMTQLQQVMKVFWLFVNLLLLEVIVLNIVLEDLHQLHLLFKLVQIIQQQSKLKIVRISRQNVQLNLKQDVSGNQNLVLNNQELLLLALTSVVIQKSLQFGLNLNAQNIMLTKLDYALIKQVLNQLKIIFKAGSAYIDATACSSYSLPDTATTDQETFDYFTSIKDNVELLFGYTSGATKFSARTCEQFLSKYTSLLCTTYLQKNISTSTDDACKLAGTICYLPNKAHCVYSYASTDSSDILNKLNVEGLQMKRTCRYIQNSCNINYLNRCKDLYRFNSFGKQRRMLKSNRFKLSHYIRNLQ
ncbi:unnamed protein product [Paramecium pentaurelia]|uniref:Uncharacterized protein n=1 Tax=Paramecium pentaurelia TaxID=43138 RepID=A0A8S1XBN6_9CILI|nr:unnamed protein product [Paramecium pentaurelia]